LWARCAAAWNADLPMRSADAWGIAYPKHQGKSDAMFMGRQDYLNVRGALANAVEAKARENKSHITWMNDFAKAWVNSSRNYYTDLLRAAIEGQPLAHPDASKGPDIANAQTRYNQAAQTLKNQAVEILKLESKVNACQVIRTLDNLLRAKHHLKTGAAPTNEAWIPPQCKNTVHNAGAPASDPRLTVLDPLWYLGNNPDVRAHFGNTMDGARAHWLNHGWREGRAASWNFHAPTYARVAFPGSPNQDWAWMVNHYVNHGRNEGRATMPPWLD
jgi:hypothetical protein